MADEIDVKVEWQIGDVNDDGTVQIRFLPYPTPGDLYYSSAMRALASTSSTAALPLETPAEAANPEAAGNDDCPRCGGRRWLMLNSVEHIGQCETVEDMMPLWVRVSVDGLTGFGVEPVFVASGRGAEARHPTYEGAVAAWRAKVSR